MSSIFFVWKRYTKTTLRDLVSTYFVSLLGSSQVHFLDFFSSGIFFVLPCIESYQKVDLRTITLGVPPQEVSGSE